MNTSDLDIQANRSAKKYGFKEMLYRIFWMIGQLLFRYSFRTMFAWRAFLLRLFGAKVGNNVHIYNSATIYMPWNLEIGNESSIGEHAYIYNLGKIMIGSKTTISHKAHLCAGTHDYSDPTLPLLKPSIYIGDQVWVCADSFVGPGVTVENGCVIAARAVVTKNVEAFKVVAGNPAKPVKERIIKKC
jgi:putative colanic acid biosynthesis acetyltransferase WcaF